MGEDGVRMSVVERKANKLRKRKARDKGAIKTSKRHEGRHCTSTQWEVQSVVRFLQVSLSHLETTEGCVCVLCMRHVSRSPLAFTGM